MRAFLFLAALPLFACGAAATTSDARSTSTSNSTGTSDDAGTTGDSGTLLLQAFGGAAGEVAAQVPLLESGVGPEQTCGTPVSAGACQLTSCTIGGIGSPGTGYGNFGPMTASVGSTSVSLTYDGTGYPTVYFPSTLTLGTGGIMTFHGGGGAGVPTFDVPATIPGLAVLSSPVPQPDGGAEVIDTSQDLQVTWSPIAIGQIHFTLNGGTYTPGGAEVALSCTFGGAAGSGVVPQTRVSPFRRAVAPADRRSTS